MDVTLHCDGCYLVTLLRREIIFIAVADEYHTGAGASVVEVELKARPAQSRFHMQQAHISATAAAIVTGGAATTITDVRAANVGILTLKLLLS